MWYGRALRFFVAFWGISGTLAWGGDGPQDQKVNLTPIQGRSEYVAPNLRLDVHLVLVPVNVTDGKDHPINSLPKESFRILEDGVEQKITAFSQEDSPVSMGLLFDSSASMKSRIADSVESLKLLFKTTIPGDEFFLVQFSDQASQLTKFTPEPNQIFEKLGYVQARGWTALLDAIAMGCHTMRSAKNRQRVLLVLSDGNDNNSRFTETEIRNMVIESDLRVYGIGVLHRPRLLQQLAAETGGNVLIAQNLGELPDVVERLSREIRSQYVLGYSSSNAQKDGKYRKVKIEIAPPPGSGPLQATWRRGYYAPEH
jgi:Ca-activated chloride channel family protein